MPKLEIERTKVAIFPNDQFEAVIGTFLNKSKYEIVPVKVIDHVAVSKYAQNLYGDWCFPIKLHVAMFEKLIVEQNVEVVFTLNFNICSYPMIMSNLHNTIKHKFSFHPIVNKKPILSIDMIYQTYKQLKKLDSSHTLFRFLKKFGLARWKANNIKKLKDFYLDNLPKVKNPVLYKKEFNICKYKFIKSEISSELKLIVDNFHKYTKENLVRDNVRHKILLSGDLSVASIEFSLFDIDIFLAKNGIRMVTVFHDTVPWIIRRFLDPLRVSKKVLSDIFSSKNKKLKADGSHLVEAFTLRHILWGLEQGVEGIIFVKPNMCAPTEHVSYILKQNNYFDLPFVELTYDEHSGLNGIMTRLEAFINVLDEMKK